MKIFYSTGLHYKHQQCRQEERIKRLNQRKGVDFTSERKFGSGNNINKADVMVTFQKSQRESYEDYLNRSIPTYYINLSTYPKLDSVTDIESKNFSETRKNFLWFGGSGLVSKGLDITLDIFKNFDDINLFVAGPVEGNEEFIDTYYNEIYDTNNIEFLGFVDITGNRFENMVNECAYHIYPTAVDPLSSSVATCMRAGLIPIAPSNPVSGIENWGISLKNTSLEHIEETVRDCASKDPKEVQSLSKIARQKANSDFTRPRFSQDLHSALIDILIDKNNSYQRDP
ncbi:MAG: glycosyltransferase [Halobacteriaceae archaeon]